MEGKVAIITGGTSGIGLATAMLFAQRGASVVIAGRREDAGKVAEAELLALGARAAFVRADVSSEADVEKLIDATVARFGHIDFAFNNAGPRPQSPTRRLHDYPVEDAEFVWATHIKGTFLCLKHEVRYFLSEGREGAIVNMSSVYGDRADFTAFPPYVAAKHAILGLTRSAAIQYATDKIRVNAVCPGVVETPLTRNSRTADPERLLRMHPMGRLGQPEDVAGAVVWLCSPEAAWVTGIAMPIDGGNNARC